MAQEEKYPLPEHWKNFVLTRENIALVWEKLNQFPILFDDNRRGNFQDFLVHYMQPDSLIFLIGDFGIARMCNLTVGRGCDIHLAFWDRRFRGRDAECKQAMKWLFDRFKLERATIIVPETVHSTINFIKALGFRQEGQLRRDFLFRGRLLNRVIFGILKDEVFREEANEGLSKGSN